MSRLIALILFLLISYGLLLGLTLPLAITAEPITTTTTTTTTTIPTTTTEPITTTTTTTTVPITTNPAENCNCDNAVLSQIAQNTPYLSPTTRYGNYGSALIPGSPEKIAVAIATYFIPGPVRVFVDIYNYDGSFYSNYEVDVTGSGQWTTINFINDRASVITYDGQFVYLVYTIFGLTNDAIGMSRFFVTTGQIDTSIGTNGYLILANPSSTNPSDYCYATSTSVIRNSLYVAGNCRFSGSSQAMVMKRFLPSLAPDTTFGNSDGITSLPIFGWETSWVSEQTGTTRIIGFTQNPFVFALDEVSGTLDTNYATGGILTLTGQLASSSDSSELVFVNSNYVFLNQDGSILNQIANPNFSFRNSGKKVCPSRFIEFTTSESFLRYYENASAIVSYGNVLIPSDSWFYGATGLFLPVSRIAYAFLGDTVNSKTILKIACS